MSYFFLFFFFFKQKMAYEMRISDWSSDVCSSDLFAGVVLDDAHGNRHQLRQLEVVETDHLDRCRGACLHPPTHLSDRPDDVPVVGAEDPRGRIGKDEECRRPRLRPPQVLLPLPHPPRAHPPPASPHAPPPAR